MAIYEGLSAHRARPDAEPAYVHDVCRQVLKRSLGRPDNRRRSVAP
jgi:hypothetical protein